VSNAGIWLFAFTVPNVPLVVACGSVLPVTFMGSLQAAMYAIANRKSTFFMVNFLGYLLQYHQYNTSQKAIDDVPDHCACADFCNRFNKSCSKKLPVQVSDTTMML